MRWLAILFAAAVGIACAPGFTVLDTIAPAFYVATNGNDSNVGTLAAPFATLHQCKLAMEGSATNKTCYIRSGSYAPPAADASICNGTTTCAVALQTTTDDGQTWSNYPPDGVNNADITGGSTSDGTGLWDIFFVGNAHNITIIGLKLHNFRYSAISSLGGSQSLTVKNNVVSDGFCVVNSGNCVGSQNEAGIHCYGCASAVITNNAVTRIASFGIAFSNVSGNISNLVIQGNYVASTCTSLSDCGAIYVIDTAATATGVKIKNNYIEDGAVIGGLNSGSAIYLDDCMSNVTISGNVVTGNSGGNTTHIHGGNNNVFSGNLIDLSTRGQKTIGYQTSAGTGCVAGTMSGNHFQNNIVISGGGGTGYQKISGSPVNPLLVANNAYRAYTGAAISTTGDYTDSNPVLEDPMLTCWAYKIAAGSPVFNSPVSCVGLPPTWGPPGFVIPQTGTVPSSPHSC